MFDQLGYQTVNVIGISYGTRLGLELARQLLADLGGEPQHFDPRREPPAILAPGDTIRFNIAKVIK